MNRIVGVKFPKRGTDEYEGKEYNYYDEVGVSVGDLAVVRFGEKEKVVLVTSVDVPENQIDERILPIMKFVARVYDPEEQEESDNE